MPQLAWMTDEPDVTCMRKDCINGFVGGIEPLHHGTHGGSRNRVVDWVNAHRLKAVVTIGICTDICVMDFVLTLLSARNHGLMPTLKDVVVLEPACATYVRATIERVRSLVEAQAAGRRKPRRADVKPIQQADMFPSTVVCIAAAQQRKAA